MLEQFPRKFCAFFHFYAQFSRKTIEWPSTTGGIALADHDEHAVYDRTETIDGQFRRYQKLTTAAATGSND